MPIICRPGFEIDNPHLVSSGDTGTLSWISDAAEPVNTEFRDDRFTAAFERKTDDAPVFTVAYVVRAVAPGKYVRPQAERRGHVSPGPLRPHRDRERGSDGGEMTVQRHCESPLVPTKRNPDPECTAMPRSWVRLRAGSSVDSDRLPLATALLLVLPWLRLALGAAGWWIASLGPAPLGKELVFSTRVVDRDGRLLRAYATTEGRWRLPARTADVDPRFFDCCSPMRTNGSARIMVSIRWRWSARRCSSSAAGGYAPAARR